MFRTLLTVALLAGPASPHNGGLALSVSPHFTQPGQKVKAEMFIPETPTPREACLIWEGESEEGRKCWTHDSPEDFPLGRSSYSIILHTSGVYEFQLQVVSDKLHVSPTIEVEVR